MTKAIKELAFIIIKDFSYGNNAHFNRNIFNYHHKIFEYLNILNITLTQIKLQPNVLCRLEVRSSCIKLKVIT